MSKFNLVFLFLLASCASSGVKIDQTSMAQFHKGQTTYADVIAALGKPSQSGLDDSGNRTISYIYMSAQARPESFIPVIGAFVGGIDSETSSASFFFDARGVLIKSAQNEGGMGYGTGFEGISQDRKSVREVSSDN